MRDPRLCGCARSAPHRENCSLPNVAGAPDSGLPRPRSSFEVDQPERDGELGAVRELGGGGRD